MSKVIVVSIDNYDNKKIYTSLKKGLKELGGLSVFVSPEEKILVKPNFLYPSATEKAVTTHPVIIEEFLRILDEEGYHSVKIGDSCANGICKTAIEKAGLSEEKLHGARIAQMNEEIPVRFSDGKVCRNFIFTKDVVEADAIIGISKMKTHMLERITGAVKNMYGLVCGYNKAKGHVRYSTANKFAKLLCDIHRATPQRLHIMDGIIAMEGNGPASGNPINMNVLIVSNDPVALDSVFARLVYLTPELVPTIVQGELCGLGNSNFNNIEITLIKDDKTKNVSVNELVKECGNPDFDVMKEKEKMNILSLWSKLNGGSARPVIDTDKCIHCGICVEHCPVEGKAINFKNGRNNPPVYDYRKCIRCYCCQELCPQKAISVKR